MVSSGLRLVEREASGRSEACLVWDESCVPVLSRQHHEIACMWADKVLADVTCASGGGSRAAEGLMRSLGFLIEELREVLQTVDSKMAPDNKALVGMGMEKQNLNISETVPEYSVVDDDVHHTPHRLICPHAQGCTDRRHEARVDESEGRETQEGPLSLPTHAVEAPTRSTAPWSSSSSGGFKAALSNETCLLSGADQDGLGNSAAPGDDQCATGPAVKRRCDGGPESCDSSSMGILGAEDVLNNASVADDVPGLPGIRFGPLPTPPK